MMALIQISKIYTALSQVSRTTSLEDVLPDSPSGRKLCIPDIYAPESREVIDVSITHPGARAYIVDAAETAGAGWGGSARARAGPSYVLMKSVCRTALRSARTVSRRRRVPVMGSGM